MAMDPRIREAIEAAVREGGQDASLSRKLVAWFEELSSGNEGIEDAERHLKLLYDSTTLQYPKDVESKNPFDEIFTDFKFDDGLTPDVRGEQSDSDGSPDR